MKLQMSFGENLINLRKQKGWSQDDLADNLNLSRQAISKWENDTSKPDVDNIEKISKIFSVSIDDLLNNDVVKDKAVTLNVREKEKKERKLTIVRCMIIAVIILYIINVIFNFASLLIIVNGIQKYANLSNYHYVIKNYDENGLVDQEECWFKDGVSKTVNTIFKDKIFENIICIDYINSWGYTINNNIKSEINVNEYLLFHKGYENGEQLISKFPDILSSATIKNYSINCLKTKIKFLESWLAVDSNQYLINLKKDNLFPRIIVNKMNNIISFISIEIGTVEKLNI